MGEPIIFHIDVNSAYLSWEACYRLHILGSNEDLRDLPSAVGGDIAMRHGIILAKSQSAKQYKIQTGDSIKDAKAKCPHLILVPPHYHLYEASSLAFMDILKDFSPTVEQYSIDEAYCDMSHTSHLYGSPVIAAHLIKDKIRDELGFTVNIGISSNKLLAKMASDFQKPDRVHTLFPHEIKDKMWCLPISDLFYVGKATMKKLNLLGIHTIGELAHSDPFLLKKRFGKHGELIHCYANGIDCSRILPTPPPAKGYGNSTTISFDVTDSHTAKHVILSLCETVCTRLRKDNVYAGVISVEIKDCNMNSSSHQHRIFSPTNTTLEAYDHACLLFDQLWKDVPIRKLGVRTSGIVEDVSRQMNLFDMDYYDRLATLDETVDTVRLRYGDDSIRRASYINSPIYHMIGGISPEKKAPLKDYYTSNLNYML